VYDRLLVVKFALVGLPDATVTVWLKTTVPYGFVI
jgi:hypothetical protein